MPFLPAVRECTPRYRWGDIVKLTIAASESLARTLQHAERARAFLRSPAIAVCRKGGPATTTLHYTRADGSTLYEISTDLGSDLQGLDTTIAELRRFLDTHGAWKKS